MSDAPVRVAAVRRMGGAEARPDSDLVAVEEPLLLEIEHGPHHARTRVNAGVLLRTPGADEDLAAGLLFSEGFLTSADDIEAMVVPSPGHFRLSLRPEAIIDERLARRVLVRSSACGLCGRDAIDDLALAGARAVPSGPAMAEHLLRELPARLRMHQQAFNETGGLHAAGFFDVDGQCIAVAEDIGRHNAVDKLVGRMLRSRGRSPAVLVVSGRAAFEIVHKAVMAGVPILAAVGAPSSLAVETARAFNLTLAGFLRGDRFNVYSGFDRIV